MTFRAVCLICLISFECSLLAFNKNASVFGNMEPNRNNPVSLLFRTAGGSLAIHNIHQKKEMVNFAFNCLTGDLQSSSGIPISPSSTPFLQLLSTFRALLGAPSQFQRPVWIPKQSSNYVSPSKLSELAEKPICP